MIPKDDRDPPPAGPGRGLRVAAWAAAAALLGLFLWVRWLQPWFADYESEWSFLQAWALAERGVPPFPLYRIRNTHVYIGQLHLHLAALAVWLRPDPASMVALLGLLNAGAAALLFALLWRTHGLAVALAALFLLAFSLPSVARSTSPHARCFSVPFAAMALVGLQRALVLGQHRWLPLAAAALALAAHAYGLATVLLVPGALGLVALYRPRIPAATWALSLALVAVLQVPVLVAEGAHGWPTFGRLLRGQVLMDNPSDGLAGPGEDGAPPGVPEWVRLGDSLLAGPHDEGQLPWRLALAAGVVALAVLARAEARRGGSWRRSPSAFLLLWGLAFLAVPLAAGAGNRTYLGQFLGPVAVAVAVAAPLALLARAADRRARWAGRAGLALAGAFLLARIPAGLALPPAPLSEPVPPPGQPSLAAVRALVGDLNGRGLGRPAFQQRVHGWPLLGDFVPEKSLFRAACRDGDGAPCEAGPGDLPPGTRFLVALPSFPLQPADAVSVRAWEGLRLFEYRSRLEPAPGEPAWPGRRATMSGWLLATFLKEPAYAAEAAPFGPPPPPGEARLRATLSLAGPVPEGHALVLVLDLADEPPGCTVHLSLDGTPLEAGAVEVREAFLFPRRIVQRAAEVPGRAAPGDHAVEVLLRGCTARHLDFYDLLVKR